MQRCGWVSQDPLYIEYHDTEWGVAQKEGRQLFEMICLEGQQAGLSWITVLKKRQNYRRAFHQFDPVRVAAMGDDDIERLLQDTGIIRHRGKIQAIIGNARAYLAMEENGESFTDFVWSFVDNAPQVTRAATLAEIPATTPASDALSKALKKRGFKFVGSTICYSFMQACGLVNDHVTGCFCHPEVRMIRKWDTEDTAPLLALWLDSTIHAHPFISESYWRDSVAVVRDVYLPAASTRVWEQDGELKGFVSVLDSRFVGALFVAPGATRRALAGRCWMKSNGTTPG